MSESRCARRYTRGTAITTANATARTGDRVPRRERGPRRRDQAVEGAVDGGLHRAGQQSAADLQPPPAVDEHQSGCPITAEDRNGVAVSAAFATGHPLSRLSDLVPLAAGLTFGGPRECPQRPLCLPGLTEVYGLHFGEVRNMPSRAATVEALVAGQIQVGLLETTDARLEQAPVVLLTDDRALQPHENVVPLVRAAVLDRLGRTAAGGPELRQRADCHGGPHRAEPGRRRQRPEPGTCRRAMVGRRLTAGRRSAQDGTGCATAE